MITEKRKPDSVIYQVRSKATTTPQDRGVLIAEFAFYANAFRRCQREQERGDKTAFVSKVTEY